MLEYGTLPVYKANDPVREKTKEYTYNFTGWNSEIEEVTDNKVYVAVFSETKNEYTVTFKDNDEVYGTKKVEYGKTVEEISPRPSKENNIFRGWKKENKEEYDFSEIVTEDITLISYYEEVEKPVISHEPIDWTNDKVMVTITNDNHPEYSFKYKIGNGEYKEYTGPFEVLENSVVTAKSIKENVESIIEIHEIKNIDKIKPSITSIEETSITPTSATVIINGIDNESGVKEIKLYKENNGQYEELISNEYNLKEASLTYTINNLEELTTYKLKVEIIDNATNVYVEEKEVTTTEKIIVAKIVGRNGTLNKDLIEKEKNDIGESITEEQIKEIEEKYPDEKYENLESAIEACNNNQCTIEMVLDTNESVDILDMQDVTLDLNGKTVTGTRDYTILNSGKLIIKDLGETVGSITNENAVSIKNTGTLTLGELEEELEVSTTKPNIVGNTSGIETSGTFNFYDGRIEGIAAVSGTVTKTPYLYNARVESGAKQVVTLTILAEAEARINTTYYTKVSNAMNEAKKGYYNEETETVQNLTKITKANKDTEYEFKYDEETGKLTSTNQGILNSVSNSYIKIDLTNYTEDQKLTVNAEISCRDGNYDVGYATITNSIDVPTYDNSTGRFIYIYGEVPKSDYIVNLKAGKVYYLHLGYRKYPYLGNNVRNDTFTINSIKLEQIEEGKLITSNTYGFKYNEETGALTNTNQGIQNSVSNSYVKLDLTKETEDKTLIVNAQISSQRNYDIGYATVTENTTIPAYNNSTGRFIYISGDVSATDYQTTLSKGKIYYLHLGYRKYPYVYENVRDDTFTINSIKYSDGTNALTNTETGSTDYTNITKVPVLNEEPDTIELLKNITLSSSMEIEDTRDVILDLRGQTLTTQTTDYIVKNHGNLKIIDSKYTDDIDSAQKKYEEEEAQNQLEYENALSEYDTYKNQTQNSYNEEYKEKINNEISNESELKTKQEEYEKKLKEYNDSHYEFDYTGDVQEYIIPKTGSYQVELWGAAGNNNGIATGKGAYTKGTIHLEKGTILYIYVGSQSGYNGGGGISSIRSGGGATDIRLNNGTDFETLKSRIMVAAGGGGHEHGASGGTIDGINGGHNSAVSDSYSGLGATQISGGKANSNGGTSGSFGQGGNGLKYSDGHLGGSGGGGYYGGSGAKWHAGGGSGSSFISGYDGCDAISDKSTEDNIIHTGQSVHYSGLKFTNTTMKSGSEEMPTHDGTTVMTGNTGNGYARITKLDSEGNEIAKPTPVTNGYSTDDYVKENLLLQLDGISHGNTNNYWADLSGNNNNVILNNVVLNNNYYHFNGSNSYGVTTNEINYNESKQITIEFFDINGSLVKNSGTVLPFESSSNTNVNINAYYVDINQMENGKLSYLHNKDSNNYSSTTLNKKLENNIPTLYTLTIDTTRNEIVNMYVNGKPLASSISVNRGDGGLNHIFSNYKLYFGARNGSSYFAKMDLASFRLYNKVLTEEEIKQNYKIDNARYEVNPYKLTSNTSYGTVTSSNEDGSYKVFDGNNETSWTSNSEENYILWQMPEEKTVTGFKIYGSSEASKYPKEVELLGSKDGENYDSLVTSELEQKGLNEYNTVQIETNKYDSYKYFKWKFKNDGNEISINEIDLDIYDISRKIFKDSDNITLNKNNFSYGVKNKTSSNMDETEKSLNSYTSNSENMSVTYLNQKVTVTDATPVTANIKLGYYNNWSSSSLGTVYIGFSKTNEINKDDFTTYIKRELNNRTEKIEDISVKIIEPGEYYLKMILYHNSNSSGYTVYGNIYDLSISKVPTRKQAVLAESTQLGNITSTTGNVILNDENANLVVDQAIINVNKSGTSSSWTNGISNYGILKINEQGVINNNSIYAIGIDNKKLGNILESSGTVNVKKESGYSYGLRNKSKNTDEINGLKFNIVTNSYGILHYASKNLKIKNIVSSGNGTAIYMGSNNNLSLENNNINSSRALVLGEKNGTVNVTSGNYSSTNYTLGIYNNNVKGTININGGIIKSTLTTLYDVDGTFNINGGEITASRYNIEFDPSTQTGTINMNDGQIVSNGDNVHGYSATVNFSGGNVIHKSGNGINLSNYSNITLSNDFSFSKESVGNGIYLNSTGNVVVKDNAKITGDVGIENATNGGATILLKDNAVIDARIGINGRNGGNFQTIVTMGEKDGEVKKDYPKINSKEKAITNSSILNIYDGSLIGLKDNSIGVIVNDSEDNYDLLIQDESDTLEKVTIAIPNLEEFGNVAQIGNTYYPSIKSAVEALSDSEENKITVLKNIKTILSNNIDDLKNCVLDLNGKNIKLFKNTTFITNSGTLKLIDSQNVLDEEGIITTQAGSIQGTGIIVENNGTLVNEGAYITTTGSSTIENTGVVNIISGTIKGYGSNGVIHNSENGEIKITGGKFELLSGGKIIYNESSKENAVVLEKGVLELKSGTGIVSNKGIVTINGGEIKGTASSGDAGGVSVSTSKIIINNGTINISGSYYHNSYGASIGNSGEIEINGGNISATYGISYGSGVTNAKLIINGGTINSYYTGITMNDQNNSTLIITGGTITSSNGTTIINQQPRSTGNIMITGGTIVSQTGTALANYDVVTIGTKGDTNEDGSLKVSKESPEIIGNVGITNNGTLKFYDGIVKGKTTAISGTINEIEEGYEIISTSDATYKEIKYLDKLPIAEIESTGTQYYNLQEAIDASTDGDTIKIIRKATILQNAETVTNTKNITLDINGYEVKVQNSPFITNSGTLKLIDSQNVLDEEGIITTQAGSIQGTGIIVENNGTLVNEGAYITTTGSSTIKNTGIFTLESGSLAGKGAIAVLNNSDTGEIKINGGKIIGIRNDGSTQNLIKNTSTSNNAIIIEKCVLDLGFSDTTPMNGIETNAGTIKLSNTNITGTSDGRKILGIKALNGSKVIYNSGTISVDDSWSADASGIYVEGDVEINGGNIYGEGCGTSVAQAGKLVVNGGVISSHVNGLENNSSNNVIINDGEIKNLNTEVRYNSAILNNASGIITIKGGTISAINNSSVKNNGGTLNIEGGTYSSNNTVVNNESGIVNMSNVSIENVPVAVTNNTGTININESVTINASDKAINNTGTGIINIGTKDKQVSVTNPSITGTNYGVYNVNGKINYYDGIITGALNQAIYGVVNEVEPGYKIKSESNESTTSSTLTVIGTDERVAVVNGMNFTNLQEAINACPDNIETDVTLYSNITLNSNILVSANKKIKLYLNGYSITYGDYNFTKEGSLEIITNNSNTVAGNIINTVKDILNISNVSKNIIVYEMDDGSKLDANKEYTLYLNGEKVKMNEEDNLGRYSLGNKEETMKTVRERLYLNKLYEGKYEVVSDDGNKATFWVTKEGQVLGTARENIVNEENNLISSAFAELIITIQTGIIKGRYILLISLISVIMLLLFSIRRQKRA